jgi:hypothetical protein
MTTDTSTPSNGTISFSLSIWIAPTHARVDTVHPTEAQARAHLATVAARHGLTEALAELLPDEISHRDLTLGGHHVHPLAEQPSPLRWQIVRAMLAVDPVPGDEHVVDAVLQFRGILLADPGAVAVPVAELAVALGPGWHSVRGMIRRAAVATPEEAARLRDAWDSAMDDGGDLTAAADAVHAAHHASRRAAIGAGAWDELRRADVEGVGTAVVLAAGCAARATMVEDLVGQHGLTAAHVALARRPWCAAFGEIGV